MWKFSLSLVLVWACGVCLIICLIIGSYGNLEDVKSHAEATWKNVGFEIVGYERYQWGFGGYGTSYGGAHVWHRLKKIPDNGISYTGFIQKWGNEYHIYGPKATDAIQPNN